MVIEAIQYDGSLESIRAIARWANAYPNEGDPWVDFVSLRGEVIDPMVHTREGLMAIMPGDWVLKGGQDEFYPCAPDLFAATYEPADTHAEARITTYDQLSAATGIPVARLERLQMFAPEGEEAQAMRSPCLAPSPFSEHRCTEPRGHAGVHHALNQYSDVNWAQSGTRAPEPQTQASAAIADAATWGPLGREGS